MINEEKRSNKYDNIAETDLYSPPAIADPLQAIAQSAPINNITCKQGIADVFNSSAFISPANIIQNPPGILRNMQSFNFMPYHDDELIDPGPMDTPFIFSTSIRNSRRHRDMLAPPIPSDKDILQSVGLLGFDDQTPENPVPENPEKSTNKRKGNIYTSKRNTDLFPYGMSRRQSSRESFSNTILSVLKRRNNEKSSLPITTEGGKHYSHEENVVLVGNIYEELFKNPALKKKTWTTILQNFNAFFEGSSKYKMTCARSAGALERHFKVLKEQNRSEGGKMFKTLYQEFQLLQQN